MESVMAFLWLAWLLVSVLGVFQTVGVRLMVMYFPEGRRWWLFPSQIIALAVFAAAVHFHPF
jgi:hypothetical protein